jgi:deoxyribose-phosphate aldolase
MPLLHQGRRKERRAGGVSRRPPPNPAVAAGGKVGARSFSKRMRRKERGLGAAVAACSIPHKAAGSRFYIRGGGRSGGPARRNGAERTEGPRRGLVPGRADPKDPRCHHDGFCDDHGIMGLSVRSRSPLRHLLDAVGPVDKVGVEERAAKFATRSLKKASKRQGLAWAVSMVDLTTLEGKDTAGKVESLCRKALRPDPLLETPPAAAVCVYPSMVRHARRCLGEGSPVRVASVATAFPSGQAPLRTRLGEVKAAVRDGADEIDMVISRGLFLEGRLQAVQDEIEAVREACGEARLKVILEVSELESYDTIRAASFLAMEVLREGDFIKTSTGKTAGNATLANHQVMIEAIRDHYLATGVAISMKPAGGIKDSKQALAYLVAVKETLGDAWLNNTRYRFGASSLLNDLLMQLRKQHTGFYQAPWNFSDATAGY